MKAQDARKRADEITQSLWQTQYEDIQKKIEEAVLIGEYNLIYKGNAVLPKVVEMLMEDGYNVGPVSGGGNTTQTRISW